MKRIVGGAVAASALVAMLGWSAASFSAPDAASVVKERQATMKRQSADLKSIKQYLDGSADQAAATKAAGNLLEAASSLHTLFPKGTGMDEFPGKSGAKPVIWSEPDKFSAAQKTLVEDVQKLDAAIKSGDKKAAEEQFSNVGKNGCGGCHGTFRQKLS
jgi:cytochrome c556